MRWGRIASAALVATLSAAAPAAANPISAENARPGENGWEISPDAGQQIAGYASEVSVRPGQEVHLHVAGPVGSAYRIELYRLGWYGGAGGRRIACVPGCTAASTITQQNGAEPADPHTLLRRAGWPVSDRITVPSRAVSGYYEAKLELLSGPAAGAMGFVPFIVREAAPRAAMLVQVPVDTWQAYNPWGGRSLYPGPDGIRGYAVSFDRPYDTQEWLRMQAGLELPWVRFLERRGVDLAYQTDLDTDVHPQSLLEHRLVFGIGHDEYWTQRMRDGFNRAQAGATNLIFGSNAAMWRVRYAEHRRTIFEWRDPANDPAHDRRIDTGEFRVFGQAECGLMGAEYQPNNQRYIGLPPSDFTIAGNERQPWLAAGGLRRGTIVPGILGYEWDVVVPGCFGGRSERLMHATPVGSDGTPHPADMVLATAHSGARVLALGTMELCRALDAFAGGRPDRRIQAFAAAALRDLQRPPPPARLSIARAAGTLTIRVRLGSADRRIERVRVSIAGGPGRCADALHRVCRLRASARRVRLVAVAVDRWGSSAPLLTDVGPPARSRRGSRIPWAGR